MSTYNGSKYIREQLESIAAQKDVSVKLLIRDDGSTDNTVEEINTFKQQFSADITLLRGSNIGWKNSFLELIFKAVSDYPQFDYIAFCDQDDIWLPEKLHKGVESLGTLPDGPKLYCSNLTYYKEGEQLGMVRSQMINNTPKGALIRNYATGCTIIFNRKLLLLLGKLELNSGIPHDYWAYLTATMCGTVYADHNSYILYRQHSANQIGSQRKSSEIWKRRLRSASSLLKRLNKDKMASNLLRLYGNVMLPEARVAVEKLVHYRSSLPKRINLLFDKGYTYNNKANDVWLRLRILFGKL